MAYRKNPSASIPQQPYPKNFNTATVSDDTFKLLNILDSFHDFTGKRNNISLLTTGLVTGIFEGILNGNTPPGFKKYCNKSELEHEIFEEFVTNNSNITKFESLPLNGTVSKTGVKSLKGRYKYTAKDIENKKNAIIPISGKIAELYNIDVSKIVIVLDEGAMLNCSEEYTYLNSYAHWFDGGSGTACKYVPEKNKKILDQEVSVSKETNQLFYLDKITGNYNSNSKNYEGSLNFIDETDHPFSKGLQDENRGVGVVKTATLIKTNQTLTNTLWVGGDKWFDGIQQKILTHTPNNALDFVNKSCMFLMDIKRSGDALQIESCKANIQDKILIFVTIDKIAATIAVNKGIRTILTTIDKPTNDTVFAIKFATLLEPRGLYRTTHAVAKTLKRAPSQPLPPPIKLARTQDPNDIRMVLIEFLKNRIPDADDNSKLLPFIKSDVDMFVKHLKTYKHSKLPQFSAKQKTDIKDHVAIFTHHIDAYIKTPNYPTPIMKAYLEAIKSLTNKYIEEDNYISLFEHVYYYIYNICRIILAINGKEKGRGRTVTTETLNVLNNEDMPFIKNIIIAKYITHIFSGITDININWGSSPMSSIYIEYFLKLQEKRSTSITQADITNVDRLMINIETFIRSDDEFKELKKNLNILEFLKDSKIATDKLEMLCNSLPPNSHFTPVAALVAAQCDPHYLLKDILKRLLHITLSNIVDDVGMVDVNTSVQEGGFNSEHSPNKLLSDKQLQLIENLKKSYRDYTYNSTEQDLYNFMKLPFEVKHMIIQNSYDKERIIKHVFETFYTNSKFDKKELSVIRYCKKVLGVSLESSRRSGGNAFVLFRESVYFYPEYIDPVMCVYMKYKNSLLPVNIAYQELKLKSFSQKEKPTVARTLTYKGGIALINYL